MVAIESKLTNSITPSAVQPASFHEEEKTFRQKSMASGCAASTYFTSCEQQCFMVMSGDAMKQRPRYSDFLAEKISISPVLFVIQHELYFFLISLLYIDVVCGENADRFIELEDPNGFRFIALGDA
jgi:hypothetical protein